MSAWEIFLEYFYIVASCGLGGWTYWVTGKWSLAVAATVAEAAICLSMFRVLKPKGEAKS